MTTDPVAHLVDGLIGRGRACFVAPGRRVLVSTVLLDLDELLAHPVLGRCAEEGLIFARDAVSDLASRCAFCRRPWTATRGPAAALLATKSRPAMTFLRLMCAACAGGKPSRLCRLTRDMLRRDLLPDAEAVHLAPGGRA